MIDRRPARDRPVRVGRRRGGRGGPGSGRRAAAVGLRRRARRHGLGGGRRRACASTCAGCRQVTVDPTRRPRWCRAAPRGVRSTPPPRSTAWPSPAVGCRAPAWRPRARQRQRLARARLRLRVRQPRSRPTWSPPTAASVTSPRRRAGAVLGAPRRGRQLRRRHRRSTLRLHPLGPIVFGGHAPVSGARWPATLRRAPTATSSRAAPDEVGSGLAFITAPPEEFVPEPVRGQPVIGVVCCYAGAAADGRRGLPHRCASCRTSASTCWGDALRGRPAAARPAEPEGMQNYWTADFLRRAARRGRRHARRARPPSRCRR